MRESSPVHQQSAGVTLCVLDRFALFVTGSSVNLPVQAQKVIAFLALHDGPQPRERVAERVWPDADLKRCLASLRTVLWRVRQATPDAVRAHRGSVCLGPAVSVDVHESRNVVRRVLNGHAVDPEHAVPLLSRRLLPDWDDTWVMPEQERVQQMHVYCLETFSRRLAGQGHYAYAMQAATAAARIEPLRESAQRAVIDVYLAEGNFAQARRVYEDFCRMLRMEMSIEPSPELAAAFVPDAAQKSRCSEVSWPRRAS
jgi:DNA-binding SARP family transcriptional activator